MSGQGDGLTINASQRSKGIDALYNNHLKKPLKQITANLRNGNIPFNNFEKLKELASSQAGSSQAGAFTLEQ